MRNFLFLHTGSPDGTSTNLIGGRAESSGLHFSAADRVDGARLAMWRLNDDDHLELAQRPGTILGVNQAGTLELRHHVAGTASSHRWKIDGQKLVHIDSGRTAIMRRDGTGVSSLGLAAAGDGAGESVTIQQLGQVVEDILAKPRSNPAFVAFQGGQVAAYAYINQQLLARAPKHDFRELYAIVNINLATYSGSLNYVSYPGGSCGFTADDLNNVKQQLDTECRYVEGVNSLFQTNLDFFTQTIDNQTDRIQQIRDAVGTASPSNVNIAVATFFVNILYTVFSTLGTAGGAVANVMATAFNTAVAAGAFNEQTESFDFATLVHDLGVKLDVIRSTTANQQDTILQDWGYIQDVYALNFAETHPQFVQSVQAGTYAYLTQVLQSVLPEVCQINGLYYTNYTSTSKAPAYAQYAYDGGAGNGVFYVSMQSSDFPQILASLLFNDPVVQPDKKSFYLGLNGWNWAIRGALDKYADGNYMIVTIYNDTPDPLQVEADVASGILSEPNPNGHSATLNLASGGAAFVISHYSGGHETDFTVHDSTGKHNLARFEAHQHNISIPQSRSTWVESCHDKAPYELPAPFTINQRAGGIGASSAPGQIIATIQKN